MKVLCDRGALLDAINLISGVVANRSPRPQLKCVKLTATKDGQPPGSCCSRPPTPSSP
jgi:DNA polymerase-3 subunit beta